MTTQQQAVLNTKDAMAIIIDEAKKTLAAKFNTTIDAVDAGMAAKNENVLSMMHKLVMEGVNTVSALV